MYQRLYVNVDHVATLRQARRGDEPDPVEAAALCESAGADGITAHLREDRRHMQDADIEQLATRVRTVLNLEIANTREMLEIALRIVPYQVTLVPERREEVTTEGGLDVVGLHAALVEPLQRLKAAGIRAALFIDADAAAIEASASLQADAIELHTGRYAHHRGEAGPLDALRRGAALGASLRLRVHAGHGLTVGNVGPVAAIQEIEELNIGHSIVSRALFLGLRSSIEEMRRAMHEARRSP
jgi:pyridoxine 5-phosphate synthase